MVLKHHVPLYMEKPVSATLEDAMKIKEMADKYEGRIMVASTHYYRPAYQKMLELVKTGMFGEPVDIAFLPSEPRFRLPRKESRRLLAHRPRSGLRHDRGKRPATTGSSSPPMAGGFDTISCNYTGTIASVPKFDNHTQHFHPPRATAAIGTIAASWCLRQSPTCSRAYIGTKGSIF